MTDTQVALLDIIKNRAFKIGSFELASGGTSEYYIDGKMIEVFSVGAYLIGEAIFEQTQDLEVEAIGGLEVGAVPLTTAAVISYHLHQRKMEGFWVRDKAKGHGTKKLVEGSVKKGNRVVIVDDVVTTGSSAVKAVEAVRDLGCHVVAVVTLVDRLQGAREQFQKLDIAEYRSVFTIRDLGVKDDARGQVQAAAR